MKLRQLKVLTDENISPKVVAFLRQTGVDVRDTKEEQWHGKAIEITPQTIWVIEETRVRIRHISAQHGDT